VTQDASIAREFRVRQPVRHQGSALVARIVAADLGEERAKRRGQPRQSVVLLRREVVLLQPRPLDRTDDQLVAQRLQDGPAGFGTGGLRRLGVRDADPAFRVGPIPTVQRVGSVQGVCPDIGDLDANRTPIRDRRMPGRLFHVEGLVDRPVQVEHEMNAESAPVLKDLKAAPAGARGIEVDHELIDHPR